MTTENNAPVTPTPATPPAAGGASPTKKRKMKRTVSKGIAHIKATFNNTVVTITDPNGDTLCWDSAGTIGFKGSRKSTPFAAQRAAENCANKARKMGVREVEVPGKGSGFRPRVRYQRASGLGSLH